MADRLHRLRPTRLVPRSHLIALTVLAVFATSCNSDEPDAASIRTIEVPPGNADTDDWPDPEPDLPRDADALQAVILEAPLSVAANEPFQFTVELRNALQTTIELSPCPWYYASHGESGTASLLGGLMPCDELPSMTAGERVRLEFTMTAPDSAVAGEVGWASLTWRLGGTDFTDAEIPLPMEGVTGP